MPVQDDDRVADSKGALDPPRYPDAQLRRVRDTDRARLAPAMHAATRVAAAVVRNLCDPAPAPRTPPRDGLEWRDGTEVGRVALRLGDVAGRLWKLGIPIVPLDLLPAPGFQGMACIVDDRPVILLGHKHDEPGRVAFVIAHEAGHVAAGDCAPGRPIVDEETGITDDAETERQADRTGDHATAVKALYRGNGARRELRKLLNQYVDFAGAAETDRLLLLCAHGAWAGHEPAR